MDCHGDGNKCKFCSSLQFYLISNHFRPIVVFEMNVNKVALGSTETM